MTDTNLVFLTGRLSADPEYKIYSGTSLVHFTLANRTSYRKGTEKVEDVSFFPCFAWGKLAEIVKMYASKGKQVCVQGRLVQEQWENQEGKKISRIKIRVEFLELLGSKGTKPQESSDVSIETPLKIIDAEEIFS